MREVDDVFELGDTRKAKGAFIFLETNTSSTKMGEVLLAVETGHENAVEIKQCFQKVLEELRRSRLLR